MVAALHPERLSSDKVDGQTNDKRSLSLLYSPEAPTVNLKESTRTRMGIWVQHGTTGRNLELHHHLYGSVILYYTA